MSERNGYEHGVPSWIAGAHARPRRGRRLLHELFGWDAERRGEHLVCTLRGRDVAGFVKGDEPAWRTHVWVESADDAAARAREAGGTVVTEPARRPRRRPHGHARAIPPAPRSPSASPTPTAAPRSSTSRARGR